MNRARELLAFVCIAAASATSHGCRTKPVPVTQEAPSALAATGESESTQLATRQAQALDEHSLENGRVSVRPEIREPEPANPWAGDYYYGDGMGMNVSLHLAPTWSFKFTWQGCTGIRDRSWGEVAERDGLLTLTYQAPNECEVPYGFDAAFIPVKWGERRYLIVPSEMKRFCNAINSGKEPRPAEHGRFLLRDASNVKPPASRPELPREFASLLLEAPLHPNVVAVKESRMTTRNGAEWRESVVTLDVGSRNGAWEGMELFLIDRPIFWGVTITRCEDTHCEAEILESGEHAPMPEISWCFSTREGE